MKQAYQAYSTIGWKRKAEEMVTHYPDMIHIHPEKQPKLDFLDDRYRRVKRESSSAGTNTLNLANVQFDLDSILQASQVISSAIDMDQLLGNIIKIIVETAGATHAAIIIDGIVEAQYSNQQTEICHMTLDEWNGCKALVEYVAQKIEVVVLGYAYREKSKRFKFLEHDPYITNNKSKSSTKYFYIFLTI
jgi:hypothetical protein